MGNTLWIESQGRPGVETHNDMSVLLRLDKPLDALADKLGVARLTTFYDYSPLNEAFDDLLDEDSKTESPAGPVWFDSAKGLESVKALRLHLETDFASLNWSPSKSQTQWPQLLMDDLKFCQTVLEEAVRRGQAFRLMIVP